MLSLLTVAVRGLFLSNQPPEKVVKYLNPTAFLVLPS